MQVLSVYYVDLRKLGNVGKISVLGQGGKVSPVPGPSGPPGTFETTCNLWDPAEPLGTPMISLEPLCDHPYSSGCDT